MWLVFEEFKKGIYFFLTLKGKNYVIVSRRAYSFFSFVKGGVRARGGKGGGCPKFSSPPFLGGCKRKFGRSQFLKTFSFFTIIIFFMFDVFFIFIIILLFFMFLKFYPEVGVIFQLHSHKAEVV